MPAIARTIAGSLRVLSGSSPVGSSPRERVVSYAEFGLAEHTLVFGFRAVASASRPSIGPPSIPFQPVYISFDITAPFPRPGFMKELSPSNTSARLKPTLMWNTVLLTADLYPNQAYPLYHRRKRRKEGLKSWHRPAIRSTSERCWKVSAARYMACAHRFPAVVHLCPNSQSPFASRTRLKSLCCRILRDVVVRREI